MEFDFQKGIIILLILIIVSWIFLRNSKGVQEKFHVVTPADTNKTYSAGSKTNPDRELIIDRHGNSRIRYGPMSIYGYDINIDVRRKPAHTNAEIPFNEWPPADSLESTMESLYTPTVCTSVKSPACGTQINPIAKAEAFAAPPPPIEGFYSTIEGFYSTQSDIQKENEKIAQQNMFLLDGSDMEAAAKVAPIHPEIYGISPEEGNYDERYRPFNNVQSRLSWAQVDNPIIIKQMTYDNAYYDLWETDVLREIQRDKEMAVLFQGKNAVPYDNINQCMSACTNRQDCIGFTVNKKFLQGLNDNSIPTVSAGQANLPDGNLTGENLRGVKVCNLALQPGYKTHRHSYEKIPDNEDYRGRRVLNVENVGNPDNIYFKKTIRDKDLDRYEARINTPTCRALCPKCALGKCPDNYRCTQLATDAYGRKCFVTNEFGYDEVNNKTFDSEAIKSIPDSLGHNMAAGDVMPVKPIASVPFVKTPPVMTLPIKADTSRSSARDQRISTKRRAKDMIQKGGPLELTEGFHQENEESDRLRGQQHHCGIKFERFADRGLSGVTVNSDKKFIEYTKLSNQLAADILPGSC